MTNQGLAIAKAGVFMQQFLALCNLPKPRCAMKLNGLLFASVSLNCSVVFASSENPITGRIGGAQIELPSELKGPHRSFPNEQTTLDVYVSSGGRPPTLVQLTWINIPGVRSEIIESDRFAVASSLLDGFLAEFSKNVSDWIRGPNEKVRIGELIGVRAKWSGKFHELQTAGVMYFVVIGKDSYCFHAFGRSDVPNETLVAATKAIEALKLK